MTTLDLTAALVRPELAGAACRGLATVMDPHPRYLDQRSIAEARQVCRRCPVSDECLGWVLSLPESADPGGVCAGLTEAERADLRKTTHGRGF